MSSSGQFRRRLLASSMALTTCAACVRAAGIPSADKWGIDGPGTLELLMRAHFGMHPEESGSPAAGSVSFPNAGTGALWHWRAVLTVPETGDYQFFISADDAGTLWFSDNESLIRRRVIASQDDWSDPKQWGKFPSQKSGVIHLEKGSRHAIEMLWRNTDGQGHAEIGWQTPGAAGPSILPLTSAAGEALVSPYQPPPDDTDDDALPDAWEKEHRLKVDGSDGNASGFGDADDDGATNQEEFLSGTDPRVADSLLGCARVTTWFGLQHHEMAFNYPDDVPWLPFKSQPVESVRPKGRWSQGAYNTAQRLRCLLTAPGDGYYQLSFDAVGFQQLLISDDSNPAGARPVLTSGDPRISYSGRFEDPRLSTESGWIHFKKGEPRYLEVRQIRNANHNWFDLAWTREDGSREVIPSACLSSHVPKLPTREESVDVENCLNGGFPGLVAGGAVVDFDLSSGKALSSGWVNFDAESSGKNSATSDPKPDLKRPGISNSFGGVIEYPFQTSVEGYALLSMEAQLCNESGMYVHMHCEREIDGVKFCRETLRTGGGAAPVFRCVTPWLPAGNHVLKLRFEPPAYGATIRLFSMNLRMIDDAAAIARVRSAFSSGNSFLPERGDNGFLISPACVEVSSRTGRAPVLEAGKQRFKLAAATLHTWWADVPLPANGDKVPLAVVSDADATRSEGAAWWKETSIFEHPEICLRVGDSLRVTAIPPDVADQGSAVVVRGGVEKPSPAGGPLLCTFDHAGEEFIQGRYTGSDGKVRSATMNVRVLSRLPESLKAIVARTDRSGVLDGLPPGAWPDGGEGVGFRANPVGAAGEGKPWLVFPRLSGDLPVSVRAGPVGPVLGTMNVRGVGVRVSEWTTRFLADYKNSDSQYVIVTATLTGLPPGWKLRYTLRDDPKRPFAYHRKDLANPDDPRRMELHPWREGTVAVGEFWLQQMVKDQWWADDGLLELVPPDDVPAEQPPR